MQRALLDGMSTTAATVAIGATAAHLAVLTDSSVRELAALQVALLEPCLALSTLSRLRLDELVRSLPLLLWASAHVSIGLGLGRALLPKSERRGALLLICAFGNAGGLPNVVVPAVLRSLQGGGALVEEGLVYVQMYLFWWRLLVWSVGPPLLEAAADSYKKTDGDEGTRAEAPTGAARRHRRLLTPPALASLVGVALGCVPAVRSLLVDGVPHSPLLAAQSLGQAGSALAVLTLGFALHGTYATRGAGAGNPTRSEVLIVCLVRLVLTPACHLLLHALVHPREGAPISWAYHLVLVLQPAMPCALSVQAVCQAGGVDARPFGMLMAMQYALALVSVSLYFSVASQLLPWLIPPAA
ncbi:hypothetical protein AB1Y20_019845 [Prymnesium parvum]|uniref:Auxin efflux carrier component n=1 Tax=Prymnesium parvum TaxID=97485 RepID=A0AB34JS13_PRYPA